MDALWVILILGALMLVYLIVVLPASLRGRQWAVDTLKAVACLSESPASASIWLAYAMDRERAEAEAESQLVA